MNNLELINQDIDFLMNNHWLLWLVCVIMTNHELPQPKVTTKTTWIREISVDPNTPLNLTDLSFTKQKTDLAYDFSSKGYNKM